MDERIDALIVGAGPTGLAAAVDALRQGLSFRIVDKAPEPSRTSKVLAMQARTLEIFEDLDVSSACVAAGRPLTRLRPHVEGKPLPPNVLEGIDSPLPYILILAKSDTERILTERLEEEGVKVERPIEMAHFTQHPDAVVAHLRYPDGREEVVRAGWLFGCDGAHSTTRHRLGLPFEGSPSEERLLLGDVRIDWEGREGEATFFLRRGDVLGMLSMRGERRFRVIATRAPGSGDEPPTLEEIQALVERFTSGSARVSEPTWLSAFRTHRRIAPRFSVGNAFLLKDAAHIHSPAGGEGMNTGIQDAYNLLWKLGLFARGAASAALLES